MLHVLLAAQNLTFLEISIDWIDSIAPFYLPRLKTLRMPVVTNSALVKIFQVPSLRHLGLGIDETGLFLLVTECQGIPYAKVKSLCIFHTVKRRGLGQDHEAILRKAQILIDRLTSLTLISWGPDMVKTYRLLRPILVHFMGREIDERLTRSPGQLERSVSVV